MTEELIPEKELDARGLQCPMPVVKTSQEIKHVSVGGILKVMATDPGSMADITAWCKSTGNELVRMEKGEGVFTFFIRRTQ